MSPLLGLLLLGADPSGMVADTEPQPEFKIEVHIVETNHVQGVTKQDPDSKDHLHIKPVLVVTPADIVSIQKRELRGPTIGSKETGFKHYPRLVVNLELTEEAKQRLKKAVLETRSVSTTRHPLLTTVVNDKHDGSWTKYILDDPTSLVYWSHFGPSVSCTFDRKKADRLIKSFTPVEENP